MNLSILNSPNYGMNLTNLDRKFELNLAIFVNLGANLKEINNMTNGVSAETRAKWKCV